MENNDFGLTTNKIRYSGCWEDISINRSMDKICGAFSISTNDFFQKNQLLWNIKKGDPFIADVDGEVVGTGYIDKIDIRYSGDGNQITFTARDRTADLVDCPWDSPINEWKFQSVLNILTILCAPYGVLVVPNPIVSDRYTKIISSFKANEGESVWEMIQRLCLEHGILPMNYGDGNISLTRSSDLVLTADVLGQSNVISGGASFSDEDRFSSYKTKGVNISTDEKVNLTDYIQPVGVYPDTAMKRYRPYVILSEALSDKASCVDRSKWEANMRAGQSISVEYQLEGWKMTMSKRLWRVNELVMVSDDFAGVHMPMLVQDVDFEFSPGTGFTTNLRLVHKDTYSLKETTAFMRSEAFD